MGLQPPDPQPQTAATEAQNDQTINTTTVNIDNEVAAETAQARARTHPKTENSYSNTTSTCIAGTNSPVAAQIDPPPQNPSLPPTKLPFRPQKIRKLSPTIPRLLSSPGELQTAINHLKSVDPSLIPLINSHPPPTLDNYQNPPFLSLVKSILYQQLAYKAGTSIYTRFISLCGGLQNVVPDVILALTQPQLRQIGVSARKSSYLHDLARKYLNGILSDKLILEMDDKSLFTLLTMVNGIGSWSVHIFMIFSLHRPDVLPVHDLGIRKGVQVLLGLQELPRPLQMGQLCEKWRPYRSVAAWYVWKFMEAKVPNSYAGDGWMTACDTFSMEQQKQHQQFINQI